jgi:glycosyltransferase EpsD
VDTERFKPVDSFRKNELRKEYGYKENEFLLFYAAEFNKNKNQQFLIKSLAMIKDQVPNARLLLAGEGLLLEECRKLAAELNVIHLVDFLGFRKDIEKLLKMADAAVASSLREGLPVNIMEAMACSLPVIATDNRGHRELIEDEKTGWNIKDQNEKEFANRIAMLAKNRNLSLKMGSKGRESILKTYSINRVLEEKNLIYSKYMDEEGILWKVH